MKHLIMGTAGHVDHGKTALVKALTGFDCDTHAEEKRRGITIHLGFTHLNLEDGNSVGIIDVPGHADFIHTMVGGASGIDFVLLVIASDSGVMPQTREHVHIMELLGIRRGIVVLSKSDLVNAELLELAYDDVHQFVEGTFLEAATMIPVSAKTGQGVAELKRLIGEMCARVEEKPADGPFRMFADRVFSKAGFGTIVTGSVIGGKLVRDEPAYLIPGGAELRVRRLERHGEEVQEIRAGDRASINLIGLEKSGFQRGMLISDRQLKETAMLDARIELFDPKAVLHTWNQVIFHSGTLECPASMHLIDRDEQKSGERGLVQIHLARAGAFMRSDRFIIRTSSSDRTLGGGEIIDPFPLHHVRRPEKLVKTMERIAGGKLADLVGIEVKKAFRALRLGEIAETLNLARNDVMACLSGDGMKEIEVFTFGEETLLISGQCLERMEKAALKAIYAFRRRNPLVEHGASFNEIRSGVKVEKGSADEAMLELIVRGLVDSGRIKEKSRTFVMHGEIADIDGRTKEKIALVEVFIAECGLQVPLMNDLKKKALSFGIGENELKQILYHLQTNGTIYKAEGSYLHKKTVDRARDRLVGELTRSSTGITVAGFRDLIDGNRKICLLLFSIFDGEGLTRRDGDNRFLAGKGGDKPPEGSYA
ncbi:MAG: selenocysteine-specific translation elongation factor [Spirochaetes bacterium]|nr:selenocysteine-specific translation elongation factor [Spirochaetota bacterium]